MNPYMAPFIQRLEAIVELAKKEQVTSCQERITYDPVIGKNNEVERYSPQDYITTFEFKDAATGFNVEVSIKTKVAQ